MTKQHRPVYLVGAYKGNQSGVTPGETLVYK